MGNREDLLAGARQVIAERGVAKATARDIAAAAGVSLAAIGYHFGSKERLLTEALIEALGTDLGDAMGERIREGSGRSPLDGFAQTWNRMPAVFAANREAMLASLENTLRVLRDPEAQRHMNDAVGQAYEGIADDLRAAHPQLSDDQAKSLAQLDFALAQGLGILWLLSPEGVIPSGDSLAEAIGALGEPAVAE